MNDSSLNMTGELTLGQAIALAAQAHQYQKDGNGVDPYILHPLSVMNMVRGQDAKIVAVLHDTIEDTETTLAMLQEHGASSLQVESLDLLTRRANETYREYIQRALSEPLSAAVKIADHKDNTDPYRLAKLPEQIAEHLRQKYWRVSDLIRQAAQRQEVQTYLVFSSVSWIN